MNGYRQELKERVEKLQAELKAVDAAEACGPSGAPAPTPPALLAEELLRLDAMLCELAGHMGVNAAREANGNKAPATISERIQEHTQQVKDMQRLVSAMFCEVDLVLDQIR